MSWSDTRSGYHGWSEGSFAACCAASFGEENARHPSGSGGAVLSLMKSQLEDWFDTIAVLGVSAFGIVGCGGGDGACCDIQTVGSEAVDEGGEEPGDGFGTGFGGVRVVADVGIDEQVAGGIGAIGVLADAQGLGSHGPIFRIVVLLWVCVGCM